MYKGLIDHYAKYLPTQHAISLYEGQTPLIRAYNLEEVLPGIEIYLKCEGLNPTGSFKDRGMTYAVSKAVENGSKAIMCASTGNTSASAAAYAAKANIKCYVIIPHDKIAHGKLAQALAYGATILPIKGNFDEALEMVKRICVHYPIEMVNSINPYRLEGQKTAAFEVCDQLGKTPSHIFIPVGNAGNISAYWKGFKEYHSEGKIKSLPKMFGFQAEGAAPIVLGHPVENPETVATAIRIGNPASWLLATEALNESKGQIDKISDAEIIKAYKWLAKREGIFAEPASCITIAGLIKAYQERKIAKGSSVVCVLTGNGLKDPNTIVSNSDPIMSPLESYDDIKSFLSEVVNG